MPKNKVFNKCPECGAPLLRGLPEVIYNGSFGKNPPYHGTFRIIPVYCTSCSWQGKKEVLLKNIL